MTTPSPSELARRLTPARWRVLLACASRVVMRALDRLRISTYTWLQWGDGQGRRVNLQAEALLRMGLVRIEQSRAWQSVGALLVPTHVGEAVLATLHGGT